MYEGHLPNSGIQQHSAGELFPCFIVIYGNGEARWVNPEKRQASHRYRSHRAARASCHHAKDHGFFAGQTAAQEEREQYLIYCQGG